MPNATPIPLHPLPTIDLSVDVEPMVRALEQAIMQMHEGPLLYQRARQLVVIGNGVPSPPWFRRPPEAPVIVRAQQAYLWQLASMSATFVRYNQKSKNDVAVLPPMYLINAMSAQPDFPFPVLDGIVSAPTLCPNGTIITEPGYHPESRLYLDMNGTTYPEILAHPTIDDARCAIQLLKNAFCDFPFTELWHKSATLAALLSVLARHAIEGNVPMFAVGSHTPGTGKGLLIDTISTIATGRGAPCWPQTTDPEEERKQLLTIALAGDLLVHVDNVTDTFGSGPMHSALTTSEISGRLLGLNEERTVPMNTVFFTSGNNISYRTDMVRRIIPIDLDAKIERPEERTGFTHSPLLPWVLSQRPGLVIDALTILMSYTEAGRPSQHVSGSGSFEEWSALIRHALIWAGEPDPCEGVKLTQAQSDPDSDILQAILESWFDCYGTTPVQLSKIDHDLKLYTQGVGMPKWNALRDALVEIDAKWNGRQLNMRSVGKGLSARQGRRLGDKRLIHPPGALTRGGTAMWKIEHFT